MKQFLLLQRKILCLKKKIQSGNLPLLLIDGDNISPYILSKTLEMNKIDSASLNIEICCNYKGSTPWVKVPYFSNAIYHITPVANQAADLKFKSRLIKLLVESHKLNRLSKIYIAADDLTYRYDVINLTTILNVTLFSTTSNLLNIKGIKAFKLPKSSTLSEFFIQKVIKKSMNLAEIGNLLKENKIEYKGRLRDFLIRNGYHLAGDIVIGVPIKVYNQ